MTNEQRQKFKKLLKPIVMEIRQQLKEQNKNLYTASMPTPDGPLGGYVKYNDYSKKFEVGTDDDFVGRFDKENDAVEELKSMGFKNIKKESVNRLKEEVSLDSSLKTYIDKLNQYSIADFKKRGYTNIEPDVYDFQQGKTWIKITATNLGGKGQKSVFAFVDKDGNIYKPAGWNAPAKGIRGSIHDPNPPLDARSLYR